MSTLVIAEVGVNHNGDLDTALALVDAAAKTGADIVKFQSFNSRKLVTSNAPKAEYQIKQSPDSSNQLDMLSKLELSPALHKTIWNRCLDKGIKFMSTGFDEESVDLLAALGQEIFKIPSGEITNLPLLRHIGAQKKPIILSTGMSTMNEIAEALNALEGAGVFREHISVLHCTSSYPAPYSDINLRAMVAIKKSFEIEVGYSDHSSGTEVAIAAVALGASIIEKHITLDKNDDGPDHLASIEPDEFASMVHAIRNIESALGSSIKSPTQSEMNTLEVARRSIVASKPIRKGETLAPSNLTTKRPGTGISPMKWDEIVGLVAFRDFEEDELIQV